MTPLFFEAIAYIAYIYMCWGVWVFLGFAMFGRSHLFNAWINGSTCGMTIGLIYWYITHI